MDVKNIRSQLLIATAAAWPLVELYIARSYYRLRVDLYADSLFMTALGVTCFALYLLFSTLELRLNKSMLLANLSCLLLAVVARAKTPVYGYILDAEWIGLVWILLVGTGLCLFVDPKRLWTHFNANRPVLYFLGVVYLVQIPYYLMRYTYWFNRKIWFKVLAPKIAAAVRFLLELMGYELLPERRAHAIYHTDLKIWINAACSGLEGVIFFCAVFSAMMMLDYKTIPMKKIVRGFVLGIALMLALNILRITLFFMFGVWAMQHYGDLEGANFTISLFHNNIGWIMYMLGLVGFFWWFYKDADKKA